MTSKEEKKEIVKTAIWHCQHGIWQELRSIFIKDKDREYIDDALDEAFDNICSDIDDDLF